MNLARYAKLWVALSGLAAQAIADGVIDGRPAWWVSSLIAAITAAGVFAVPNAEESA
jgi:hypothetical protein